ncbi:MAG: protealysin inhibitor emfourin [Nocardioidaceae bacterium]
MSHCHFIPPYLLQGLADQTDDPDLAGRARSTLETDTRFRERRLQPQAGPTDSDAERPRRRIHTAENTEDLPGTPVRAEGEPATGDEAVDEAYDGVGATWSLFNEAYSRDSYDDAGHRLDVTVHYGRDYANAFWDGRQLVFGDGDGKVFQRFTKAPDVVAHEFTHGVTQYTAGLAYRNQPGALNESVSDVFAALTVQRSRNETADTASWLIGEGLFTEAVNGDALRSMKAPGTAYDDPQIGKDPQPATMDGYVETTDDNGGVHINSGIPNHAFYLAATAIGGHAWEQAGAIWYATVTDPRLGAQADFSRFAAVTVSAAERLFADDPTPAKAVRDAWTAVGVELADVEAPSPEGPDQGHQVTVRRSGGVTGVTVEERIDTATATQGARVEELLSEVQLDTLAASDSQPDRYVFTIDVDGETVRVQEQDVPPPVAELIDLVLHQQR